MTAAPAWTRANLRHLLTMLRFGGNPVARVYESLGTAPFAAIAGDWLNVGWWEDGEDAAHAPRRLVERLARELPPHGVVVDVGNGLGVQDRVIAEVARPRRLVAVNVTEAQLRAGRRHLEAAGAWPVAADATRLPVADGVADGVISVEAAFHFPSRPAFFREAARILLPGGVLTMSDVAVQRLPRTPAEIGSGLVNARFWAVRASAIASADDIAAHVRQAGLRMVSVELCGHRTIDPFVRENLPRLQRVDAPPLQAQAARLMLRQWELLRRRGIIEYLLLRASKPAARRR